MIPQVDLVVLSIYDGCYYFTLSIGEPQNVYCEFNRSDYDLMKTKYTDLGSYLWVKPILDYIYNNEYSYDINHIASLLSKHIDFKYLIVCDNGCIEIKEMR